MPEKEGYSHKPSLTIVKQKTTTTLPKLKKKKAKSFVEKKKIKQVKKTQTAVERRQKMNVIRSKVSKMGVLGEK